MTQTTIAQHLRRAVPLSAEDRARAAALRREITLAHLRLGSARSAREEAAALGLSTGARLAAGLEADRAAAHVEALTREMDGLRRRAALGGRR